MRRERRASNLNPGWRHALATQAPQANQREKQVPGKEGACPLSSLQEFPYSAYHKPAPAPGLGARGSGPGRVSSHPLPARTAHLSVGLLFLFFKPKPNKYAIY